MGGQGFVDGGALWAHRGPAGRGFAGGSGFVAGQGFVSRPGAVREPVSADLPGSASGGLPADEAANGTDRGVLWPAGSASGIGSHPGTDVGEALKVVLGELPDLPYLPELPARGPGADMIGRSAGFLVDLPVELYAARWRMAARPGRDRRRTLDLLERDLDRLTELAEGYSGTLKIQCAGCWTMAAELELPMGGPILRDPGAVRELTLSLAEGLAAHVGEVARRVPGARLLLQLDEPSLPAVLAGRVPTESGLRTVRAVEQGVAEARLRTLIEAVGVPVVVHCCAADAPLGLVRSAGAAAVAVDLDLISDLDALAEIVDAGLGLFAGVLDPTGPVPASAQMAARIRDLWRMLGFPAETLAERVVVTPACGLVGARATAVPAALAACRDAGRRLLDDPE